MAVTAILSLIVGDHGPLYGKGTIAAGQDLARFSVLGLVSETGQFKLCNKAANDGSQTAVAVLDTAIDTTTGGAQVVDLLRHAEVDEALLVFGGDSAIDDHREQLYSAGIYPTLRQ